MNKIWILLCILVSISFAAQPELKEAKIDPAVATVGDSVTVSVEFTGTSKDLKEVYLTVREEPYEYPRIPLKNTEKNIWSMSQEIPYDAYSGTFHLDINAIDKNGKEIVTKGFEKSTTGKAGTIELKIKY